MHGYDTRASPGGNHIFRASVIRPLKLIILDILLRGQTLNIQIDIEILLGCVFVSNGDGCTSSRRSVVLNRYLTIAYIADHKVDRGIFFGQLGRDLLALNMHAPLWCHGLIQLSFIDPFIYNFWLMLYRLHLDHYLFFGLVIVSVHLIFNR